MIKIVSQPDGNPMIISSVTNFSDSMGFCEYKVKHFLFGIKPPETQITINGKKAHELEEQLEKEKFMFKPLSQEELENQKNNVEFARESVFTRYQTSVEFEDFKLPLLFFGRADKIMRIEKTLIVEDSKYPHKKEKYSKRIKPFENQKMQALLYLNSVFTAKFSSNSEDYFEVPHDKKKWIINIKDKTSGESFKIFKGIQTSDSEAFLKEKISRFALIVMGKLRPTHHMNKHKCKHCAFLDCCSFKLS